MKRRLRIAPRQALAAALFASALAGANIARAEDPYVIDVVTSLTGGGAFLGNIEKINLEAHRVSINRNGGIAGRPLAFSYYDDETSPQRGLQLAQQIFAAQPAVILGPTLQAICNAISPVLTEGPLMYCFSNSFRPPKGGYSFSSGNSTDDMAAVLMTYFRKKGLTKIAVLNSTDATGQSADASLDRLLALPENTGLAKVEHQHFNPTDVSVAAQIERIRASGAQALFAWTTGAALATVFKGMIQAGLDIPVGTTAGNQTVSQMEQYTGFMPKEVLIGSALWPAHDGILTLDPRVEAEQHEMYRTLKDAKIQPDVGAGTTWDTVSLVVAGLRKLGAKASARELRDFIAGQTDFPGIEGIYDFKTYPDRGIGPASSTVVRYDPANKSWVWMSKPGGEPLGR